MIRLIISNFEAFLKPMTYSAVLSSKNLLSLAILCSIGRNATLKTLPPGTTAPTASMAVDVPVPDDDDDL